MKTVIIPTLNEVENITNLVHSIYKYASPSDTRVLVIDDDSTDGTQDAVDTLMKMYPNLLLVVRKGERGLSKAVKKGASLIESGYVLVMDADFSHHPSYIPELFGKISEGFDVVVGSRYISGGRIIGWSVARIVVSKVATVLARVLLRLSIKDPMSGFVAFSSASFLKDHIRIADYKFLVEIIATNRSLKVGEVPIVFRNRIEGQSKLGGNTIFKYIKMLFQLMLIKS
ncbi:MAG: polyprenol monophosphomannose synthase [Candidatus Thorarchaeota archaeon]